MLGTGVFNKITAAALRQAHYFAAPLEWDRRLGRGRALKFAEQWARLTEYAPLELFHTVRWPRLRRLIEHAYHNVPLYTACYRELGILPSDLRHDEDFARLPIVAKSDFKRFSAEGGDHVAGISPWRKAEGYTSGSTGEPLRYFQDNGYHTAKVAMANRIWRWAGADAAASKIVLAPDSTRPFYPNSIHLHPHFVHAKKDEYFRRIRASGAKLLFGVPLMTFDLLWMLAEEGHKLKFEKAVLGGHSVAPGIRAFLRDQFDCDVSEFYATGETRMVAIECEMHRGLHIQEEDVVVEVVDGDGRLLPPGTIGRVVLTSLSNEVMPFIRYEIGDLGVVLPGSCPCGRTSRRMLVEGRTSEGLFLGVGGDSIAPTVLRGILDSYFNYFHRYQVVQSDVDTLILNTVPTVRYIPKIEREIVSKIKNSTGWPIAVTVRCLPSIPPLPNGKFQYFVSELWKEKFPPNVLRVAPLEERATQLAKS